MRLRLNGKRSRVLVTGGAGYLGSIVVEQLLERGYAVRVLDSLLFGRESLDKARLHPNCELIRGDVRDIEAVVRSMTGCNTAIHLAGIVGDQACEANREVAIEVNGAATRMLADVAPRCGIRRFLFASSCSVYGTSREKVSESSRLRPLSLYAQTKADSEEILLAARTRNFAPTVLRLGTLFGVSARMRFDLVVNLLVARAISSGRITIKNGWQWRPFIHVRDAARAFVECLEGRPECLSGEIFNVGADFLNVQIRQLGQVVARAIPGTAITEIHDGADRRSYRASFDKIERQTGFVCKDTLEAGVQEVSGAIAAQAIRDSSSEREKARTPAGRLADGLAPLRRISIAAKLNRGRSAPIPIRGASTSAAGD